MNEYEKLVPSETRAFVDKCVGHARELMQRDGRLTPIAFAGNFDGGGIVIDRLAVLPKDAAAAVITHAAKQCNADFILHIDECWLYNTDSQAEAEAMQTQHKQVKDMPGRVDAVMFNLETHAGQFSALPKREPFGETFTFGEAEFRMAPRAEGRFISLLPPRGKAH
jgi:hypothetical protein